MVHAPHISPIERSASPRLWILWSRRVGDLKQMQALATALGWACEEKRISFAFSGVPAVAHVTARPSASQLLSETWPDLILCSEATCAGLAQALRKRSDGRIKVVALGRPLGAASHVDLVLTTAQYGLPAAGNVVELTLPPGEPSKQVATAAGPSHDLLLLGGSSAPDILDAASALAAFETTRVVTESRALPLAVTTSPRTGAEVVAALKVAVKPPHRLLAYGDPATNYHGLIATASHVTVTSDSVSMLADALLARKPVSVFLLPQRQSFAVRVGSTLKAWAAGAFPLAAVPRLLFDIGLIETVADRNLLRSRLQSQNLIRMTGEERVQTVFYDADEDLALATKAVRALMGVSSEPPRNRR